MAQNVHNVAESGILEAVASGVPCHISLDRLQASVDRLPPRLREIFTMTFEKGMKRGEIAGQLRVSEATVKRDRQKLIAILREEFKDDVVAKFVIVLALNITI